MTQLKRRTFLGAALCAAALPLSAMGASSFPGSRPIRLIVPYTPGGGTDAVARAIAARLGTQVGWTVIVENRPGAAGNIGMGVVANAAPDGYTLALGQTSNLAINPAMLDNMPFDAASDFEAVAVLASVPVVLVVKQNARWKTLADLIAEAQAKPGAIKQALAGSGTVGHVAGELLADQAKFEVLNVPYRGAAPALNDLLGESTDYMFATPQATQAMLKGNTLRPLAVSSRERLEILPDVPTVAESGYEGFEAVDWKAVVAPKGTPSDIVLAINRAIQDVLTDPATIAMFTAEGSIALSGSPQDAKQYISEEQKKWAALVKQTGIKAAQ